MCFLFVCSNYLSSRVVSNKVLSAQVSLTSVFGMRTGGPHRYRHRNGIYTRVSPIHIFFSTVDSQPHRVRLPFSYYLSLARFPLFCQGSYSFLNSLFLLISEIKPSTYQYRLAQCIAALTPPTYQTRCLQVVLLPYDMGYLILRRVSRLDAFSVYLIRTSLSCRAAGATTGAQSVRSSRSSRTRDKSSQISYAHDGQGPNCLTTF